MTAQIAERLTFEGQQVALLTNPLDLYFELGGLNPGFQSTSTALWRGYVGSWEVVNDRLYLVCLNGVLESGEDANLESVFPGFTERVFAHWYSGTLRIPQGKRIEYVHMGYGSTYERDVLLTLQNGVVINKTERCNGRASDDAPDGYAVSAMTVWPVKNNKDQA